MKQFTKIIVLSVVSLLFITLATLVMINDYDLGLFKTLSISGVSTKKAEIEELQNDLTVKEASYDSAKQSLETDKNSFDVAKEEYESIDESTISTVKEATKEESYFIEYLWVVLGNYATANNVGINILTPGATEVVDKKEENKTDETKKTETSAVTEEEDETDEIEQESAGSSNDGIKITVVGRYANIADFVFDVENDKELRFKLDNIVMKYTKDKKISATFDIISLMVEK